MRPLATLAVLLALAVAPSFAAGATTSGSGGSLQSQKSGTPGSRSSTSIRTNRSAVTTALQLPWAILLPLLRPAASRPRNNSFGGER